MWQIAAFWRICLGPWYSGAACQRFASSTLGNSRMASRPDAQAGLGRGTPQVAEHGVPGGQGLTGPVRADRAEQAMLDRVPLRAARRIVADGHGQSVPVAELVLELPFPDPRAGTIAAPAIGQDQQVARLGERGLPLVEPPADERIDGES